MALLRTIGGRVRSFGAIKNAVMHHGQRVAGILDVRFNSILPENLRIDFWLLMLAILEILRWTCDQLIDTENVLVGERGNDTRKQKKRDDDATTLSQAILGFRDAFNGVYRPLHLAEFGFPDTIGRTPFDLQRQGEHLVEILGKSGLTLPEPAYTGGIDVPAELDKIRVKTEAVRESTGEADRERKLAQAAKVDKDRARDSWDLRFIWGSRRPLSVRIVARRRQVGR